MRDDSADDWRLCLLVFYTFKINLYAGAELHDRVHVGIKYCIPAFLVKNDFWQCQKAHGLFDCTEICLFDLFIFLYLNCINIKSYVGHLNSL